MGPTECLPLVSMGLSPRWIQIGGIFRHMRTCIAWCMAIMIIRVDASAQTAVSTSHTAKPEAEVWYYFQNNTPTSDVAPRQQKLTLRFYQPFFFGHGWQLTMREDIPTLYTNQTGPDNPTGAWLLHSDDMFGQAAIKTPEIAPGLTADFGLRVVFPTGDLKPFGTGRYQIAPHFGLVWDLPGWASAISIAPLARYFQSLGDGVKRSDATSKVEIHPILAARLSEDWMITLWREHPLILNTLTNQWFIPLDVMVHWQALPNLSIGLGGAVSLVANYPQYSNMIYTRFALSF